MTLQRPMLPTHYVSASSAKEYDVSTSLVDLARDNATEVLEAAMRAAEATSAAARERALTYQEQSEAATKRELEAIIQKYSTTARSDLLLRTIEEVAAIQKSYTEAEVWIIELVMSCVYSVIGMFAPDEAQLAAIQNGIDRFGERWTLSIAVPFADLAEMQALRQRHPEFFAGIKSIHADASIPDHSIHLYGKAGGTEVSLSSCLSALHETLDAKLVQ